jgi:hypothetical protein
MLAALSEQIGFYFSDANLRKDRFLLKFTGAQGTDDVDISTIALFNRVKSLTSDLETLRESVRMRAGELELSGDGARVRRLRALPTTDDYDERTVYVEQLLPGCTHKAVRDVFAPHGAVVYISLPRLPSGDVKGFGFVEFQDADGACAAAAALDGALIDSLATVPLRVMHKLAWNASKAEYKRALACGQREAHAVEAARQAASKAGSAFATATAAEVEQRRVVQLTGLPKGAAIKPLRREMREVFGAVAPVDFVDYGISDSGNTTVAFVRMVTPVGAAETLRVLSANPVKLGGAQVRVELLRGDALRAYIERITDVRQRTAQTRKAKREKWWSKKYGGQAESNVDTTAPPSASVTAEASDLVEGTAEPKGKRGREEIEKDAHAGPEPSSTRDASLHGTAAKRGRATVAHAVAE